MVTPNFPSLTTSFQSTQTMLILPLWLTLKRPPVQLSERIFLKQIFTNVCFNLLGSEQRKDLNLLIHLNHILCRSLQNVVRGYYQHWNPAYAETDTKNVLMITNLQQFDRAHITGCLLFLIAIFASPCYMAKIQEHSMRVATFSTYNNGPYLSFSWFHELFKCLNDSHGRNRICTLLKSSKI